MALTFQDLRLDHYALGGLNLAADVVQQHATITVGAPQFGVNATAVIATKPPYPATLKMRVDELPFEALPLTPDTPLTGRLTATIEAVGDLDTPRRTEASMRVEALAGTWNGHPFNVAAPAVLRYAQEGLTVDALRVQALESVIAVGGTVPLSKAAPAGAIHVDARADLATLARYVPVRTIWRFQGG